MTDMSPRAAHTFGFITREHWLQIDRDMRLAALKLEREEAARTAAEIARKEELVTS